MQIGIEKPDLTSGEIFGLKTFDGGSAKIQRIPLMPDIFNAGSLEDLLTALSMNENQANLRLFVEQLGEYPNVAAAVSNLIDKSDDYLVKFSSGTLKNRERDSILFALKYIYSAMFKTAGNMTMFWSAWTKNPEVESIEVCSGTKIGLTDMDFAVQIPSRTFNTLSQTNQLIYNILVSLLNQSVAEVGGRDNLAQIRSKAIEIAAGGLGQVSIGFGKGKESIKIDYKLGKNGIAVVDINAGNMGIPDGADLLGNRLREALGLERLKVTSAVIEAVMAAYNSEKLSFPKNISVLVLDQGMYEKNKMDVDLYVQAIKEFGVSRGIDINVNVSSLGGDSIISLEGEISSELPNLVFRYTNRTQFTSGLQRELDSEGVVVIPEPFTNLIADKVSGQIVRNLGAGLFPDNIIVPEEVQSESITGEYEIELLISEAFTVAKEGGWDGIVIKTATKFRKQGIDGVDFPTAFIYPVSTLGFEAAESELKSILKNLKLDPYANSLKLSFNQLFTDSLSDDNGLERQVEIRVISALEG